jgi:hypothetical protein
MLRVIAWSTASAREGEADADPKWGAVATAVAIRFDMKTSERFVLACFDGVLGKAFPFWLAD